MPTVAIFCAFPAMSATLSGCCVHLLLSMCTHTQFLHEYVYVCVYLSLYIHIHIYVYMFLCPRVLFYCYKFWQNVFTGKWITTVCKFLWLQINFQWQPTYVSTNVCTYICIHLCMFLCSLWRMCEASKMCFNGTKNFSIYKAGAN